MKHLIKEKFGDISPLRKEEADNLAKMYRLYLSEDENDWELAYLTLSKVGIPPVQIITEFVWTRIGTDMMPRQLVFEALFSSDKYDYSAEFFAYFNYIMGWKHGLSMFDDYGVFDWVEKVASYFFYELRKKNGLDRPFPPPLDDNGN